MEKKPIAAGKSSYDLIDSSMLFAELNLHDESVLLDVACGAGAYSLAASERIGDAGRIYAVDLWQEGIDALSQKIADRGIRNIQAAVADVSRSIPVPDASVDVCLMATVLHDLIEDNTSQGALSEVCRALKPGGLLAIVEFKKIDGPPGPPVKIRISPEEVGGILLPLGFDAVKTIDIGPYNYLSLFIVTAGL